MEQFKQSNKAHDDFTFKVDVSAVEKVGMKTIINNVLSTIAGNTDTVSSLGGYFTYSFNEGAPMLTVQDKEFYLDGGSHALSHFLLTEDSVIVAVCYDEDENEVFYTIQ